MSVNTAFKALKRSEAPDNTTTSPLTQLPANLLEAFIPGYSIISRFLFDAFGFDISLLVSVCLLVFGLGTAIKYIWRFTNKQIETHLMSYIRVERHDDIFDFLLDWLCCQRVSQNSRNLVAKTNHENSWDELDSDCVVDDQLNVNGLLNFSNWDTKTPPKFEPSYGVHRFFHKGHFFTFRRDQQLQTDNNWYGMQVSRETEYFTISCLGRSTQPVKELIKEARDYYLDKQKACTTVRRPLPKESRNRGRGSWQKAATRPSRPMATVVLEHDLKERVLMDINEYLHPATPRWYSNRGIPYRRGYLLHGPPGTGKSSLAWAIAGVFGLDIYCISLVDPNLTEEELGTLFTALPRRCIVLLEDIDSAGLTKRQELENADRSKEDTEASKIGAEITKAFASVQKTNKDKEKQGISLSGLLNAIDGVASHEGRVLIMTTNFPDKLDEALIRPGRIDMKVGFTKATHIQIRELFTRMYSPDTLINPSSGVPKLRAIPAEKKAQGRGLATMGKRSALSSNDLNVLTPPDSPMQAGTPITSPTPPALDGDANIEEIAAKFAEAIPENTFTPAEIQGFLLTRKKDPLRALSEVKAWRDQLLATKKEKKVVTTDKA